MDQLSKSHHAVVEVHPVIHFAQLNVAHYVVDRRQASAFSRKIQGFVPRRKWTLIVRPVDKHMQHLTVGVNGCGAEDPIVVARLAWFPYSFRASFCSRAVGLFDVINPERNVLNAVAMQHLMRSDFIGGVVRGGDYEADLARFEHVGS